jgi:WD40 repeat protein
VDSNGVAAVAFTPGGDEVVTAGLSGVAQVWKATKAGDGLHLLGRKSDLPLSSVAFPVESAPGGRKCVAVAGWDGAVHTYELNFQLLEADARKLMLSLAAAPVSP